MVYLQFKSLCKLTVTQTIDGALLRTKRIPPKFFEKAPDYHNLTRIIFEIMMNVFKDLKVDCFMVMAAFNDFINSSELFCGFDGGLFDVFDGVFD